MDLSQITNTIETSAHRVVEALSNKQGLERIGKAVSITVATYYVTSVYTRDLFLQQKREIHSG